MLDYGTKIDNDETSAGVVVADEYNSIMQEQKNTVAPFLSLNALDNKQQAKAIDIASKAMYYTDTGTVNAIKLTRGATSDVLETLFDGMVLIFTPANANTGATTLKVKTLTAKSLFYAGSELVAGYLNTTSKYIAIYDLANDRFNVDVITGGSAKQTFKVANAVNTDEALNKGQLLTEIKAVDGAGSGLDADTVDGVQGALLGIGGAGYSWVNKTSLKALDTVYTNTTGSPIQIAVTLAGSGSNRLIASAYIDGVLICGTAGENENSSSEEHVISIIVPNGSTYEIRNTAATNINIWFELTK